MKGWECPKCGRCYAPYVRECCEHGYNTYLLVYEKLKDNSGEIKIVPPQNDQCLICKRFHPGLGCPVWTITSEGTGG